MTASKMITQLTQHLSEEVWSQAEHEQELLLTVVLLKLVNTRKPPTEDSIL